MDREYNVLEAERQLNDFTFYKALDHDPTREFERIELILFVKCGLVTTLVKNNTF